MHTISRLALLAVVPALVAALMLPASAVRTGKSLFYGNVVHVSLQNIKVHNPKTGETLSFVILPKFNQIFSGDGKETYQMKDIHAGDYVKIYYDQKALGARHADTIYIMTKYNAVKRKE